MGLSGERTLYCGIRVFFIWQMKSYFPWTNVSFWCSLVGILPNKIIQPIGEHSEYPVERLGMTLSWNFAVYFWWLNLYMFQCMGWTSIYFCASHFYLLALLRYASSNNTYLYWQISFMWYVVMLQPFLMIESILEVHHMTIYWKSVNISVTSYSSSLEIFKKIMHFRKLDPTNSCISLFHI